ncbi:AtpZ/AtpI family protein [Ensifer soli]|uniref:AtpZ/AtpI family protein n=1 Tax=Ciceribacter sp. sgz301302 TaxID=3342379 RepID=UPI0035B85A9F
MTGKPEDSLDERRKALGDKLSSLKADEAGREAADQRATENRKGYAVAVKLSSEFIAAVIVGAILGYLLDHFAGTGPWGMIVLLLLGFCAGVLNVLRSAGMVASPHPVDRLGRGRDHRDV